MKKVTAQHREMLDQALGLFDIKPDYDLNLMKSGQDLYNITSNVLLGRKDVLSDFKPDVVLVHGDTTTTSAASLSAFYQQIKVEIWGNGNPRREFLYSEDMADACVFLLEKRDFKDTYNEKDKEIRNTHINIGTGEDISIRELAYLIKDIVDYRGELYFNIDKPDGTIVKLTDSSKLHSLGWRHKVELKDGVKTMYEWYLGEDIQ